MGKGRDAQVDNHGGEGGAVREHEGDREGRVGLLSGLADYVNAVEEAEEADCVLLGWTSCVLCPMRIRTDEDLIPPSLSNQLRGSNFCACTSFGHRVEDAHVHAYADHNGVGGL